MYRDLWSRNILKDTNDTQWVVNPTRQRLATSRKRALRSRTVKAARSVCSEYRSRMIEPRKFDDCWCLPDRVRGGSITLTDRAMDSVNRPGSESGAKIHVGIPGTCEGLHLLVDKYSRNGMVPREQRPGVQGSFPSPAPAKHGKAARYRRPSSRRGRREGASGRLSRLIVAIESRVTLLGRSL